MKLYWMPYLILGYPRSGPKEVRLGKARFLPDEDQVWVEVIKSQRSNHLKLHRDFPSPHLGEGGEGDPLYGTIVVSDDEEWLRNFIDEAVAVIYFSGNEFIRNAPSSTRYGRPAECFTYYMLEIKPDSDPDTLVRYWTKHGSFMEMAESLITHPPLVTRYYIGRQYRLDSTSPEHQELVKRFEHSPLDRLVVAVRHFFRSQFSDVFRSHPTQDYAIHCAAIEAALNLKMEGANTNEQGIQRPRLVERFLTELCAIYGNDERIRSFFHGLYASRSIHVHGISAPRDSEQADKRDKDYQYFIRTNGKITLTRAITRDVIERQLGREDRVLWARSGTAKSLLWMAIRSGEIWDAAKAILTQTKAAAKLKLLSDAEFEEKVLPIAMDLREGFCWQFVRDPASNEQVTNAIITCAIVIGDLTKSTGEVYAASDFLGKAAGAKNYNEIDRWTAYNVSWRDAYPVAGDRLASYQQIAYRMAQFFEKQ